MRQDASIGAAGVQDIGGKYKILAGSSRYWREAKDISGKKDIGGKQANAAVPSIQARGTWLDMVRDSTRLLLWQYDRSSLFKPIVLFYISIMMIILYCYE